MAQHNTRKATAQGKALTITRRTVRAAKAGTVTNRSGHVRKVR